MKKSNRKLPKIIAGKKLTNDASKDVCAVTKHKIIKLICLAGPFFLPRSREQRLLQFTVVIMIKSYSRKLFKSVQCPFFNMGKKQVEGIFIFVGSAGAPPPHLFPLPGRTQTCLSLRGRWLSTCAISDSLMSHLHRMYGFKNMAKNLRTNPFVTEIAKL